MKKFTDKIILVTGAAGGQGAEEATQLVAEGARVVIADIKTEQGEALAKQLGPSATFQKLDVSDAAAWQSTMAHCERLGGLHGLVNNAGIYRPKAIADLDTVFIEANFRINQLGTMLGMQCAAPLLQKSGNGSIVNISSTAGLQGIPNAIAYVGTKWAVRGMTKAAALELAGQNIRVNSVHPGLIDTPMLDSRSRDDLAKRAQLIPLKRMGTSQDVAKLVLFLLSEESSYITGAEIAVDGGLSL